MVFSGPARRQGGSEGGKEDDRQRVYLGFCIPGLEEGAKNKCGFIQSSEKAGTAGYMGHDRARP